MAKAHSLDSTNKGISERFSKTSELISLQQKITIGTAGHYVYLSKTVKINPTMTPAKAKAAAKKELEQWADAERKQYEQYTALCAAGELSEAECADYKLYCRNLEEARQNAARASRAKKVTFAEFVNEHWLPDHIEDGTHSPSTISCQQTNTILWKHEAGKHHNRGVEAVYQQSAERTNVKQHKPVSPVQLFA